MIHFGTSASTLFEGLLSLLLQNPDRTHLPGAGNLNRLFRVDNLSVCPMNQSEGQFNQKQAPKKQPHVSDYHGSP